MVEGVLEVLFEAAVEAGGSLVEYGLEWLSGGGNDNGDQRAVMPETLYEERPPAAPKDSF